MWNSSTAIYFNLFPVILLILINNMRYLWSWDRILVLSILIFTLKIILCLKVVGHSIQNKLYCQEMYILYYIMLYWILVIYAYFKDNTVALILDKDTEEDSTVFYKDIQLWRRRFRTSCLVPLVETIFMYSVMRLALHMDIILYNQRLAHLPIKSFTTIIIIAMNCDICWVCPLDTICVYSASQWLIS